MEKVVELATLLPPRDIDPNSSVGRLLVAYNRPLHSETRSVFGTRTEAHTVLDLLPSGDVIIHCRGVEVITATFFDELLKAREDLTFTAMNEDVKASFDLAVEHRQSRPDDR